MGYSEILQTLLSKRGLNNDKEIKDFLNPSYDAHLHDPFLMYGMRTAVSRILNAISKGEKVAIYSDFDADGIPAGVILHDFFKKIGFDNFVNYIPHRDTEGYGFHKESINKLAEGDVNLIITVDVGITAVDAVKYANSLGIDVIITDHHELQSDQESELPDALAILNPKQKHCKYPFKGLCGAGVAYKLVQALIVSGRASKDTVTVLQNIKNLPEGWEKWLLDLVAIATVADMVPLVGENRALTHWGLQVLHKSPRSGIKALCNKLRINQTMLNENDIGFSIAPRINAASRMDTPEIAFQLLSTNDINEAEALASKLESLNNKRKGAVAAIVKQAKSKVTDMLSMLSVSDDLPNVIVTGDPKWSPALVGLASGSIADSLGRVACVWGRDGSGKLKGSCRSGSSGNSIVEMFKSAGDKLLHYGGHNAAGGFAVSEDNIHTLSAILNKAMNIVVEKNVAGPAKAAESDIEITLQNANNLTYIELSQLAPFGIGNPKPIIKIKTVTVSSIRHFGKDQNHIEIYIKDSGGYSRKASKFFATSSSFTKDVAEGATVDLLVNLEESAFAGRRSLELRIIDVV